MSQFRFWISVSLVATLACADGHVTGPDAKALYVVYRDHGVSAKGFTMYLDGRVASDSQMSKLAPDSIESVEILKGQRIIRVFTRNAHVVQRSQ